MPITPTPPAVRARIDQMFDSMTETLAYLAGRWQDEREYEDINDYRKHIASKLPAGFQIHAMFKRPFGFEFTVDGFDATYTMRAYARRIEWKRVG